MKGCLWEEQRVKTSGNATEGAVWVEQEKFLPCDYEMVRKVVHILLKQGQLQAQRCRKINDRLGHFLSFRSFIYYKGPTEALKGLESPRRAQ